MESHWFNRFPPTCPAARPGLRGGTAAAAALGAGRLHLRAAAGSGRGGPRRTAGGGAPCVAVRRCSEKRISHDGSIMDINIPQSC